MNFFTASLMMDKPIEVLIAGNFAFFIIGYFVFFKVGYEQGRIESEDRIAELEEKLGMLDDGKKRQDQRHLNQPY